MGTLKPQSIGPLYSNTVIGTLAVDGWAVIFGTARKQASKHLYSPNQQTKIWEEGPGRRPVPSSLYQM